MILFGTSLEQHMGKFFLQSEKQMSDYNFNYASPKYLFTSFESYEVNTKKSN